MSVRTEAVGHLTVYDDPVGERDTAEVTTVGDVTDTSDVDAVETEHKDMCPPGSLDWKHQLLERWHEISDADSGMPGPDGSDTTGDEGGAP